MTWRCPIPLLDQCRSRRTFELLAILWLLALADLVFTLWAQFFTPFTELNPFAGHLLEHHKVGMLIAFKVALTGIGTAIFWRLRRYGRAEIALWLVVIVYVGLTFRWSEYTSQILAMGSVPI